MVCFGGLKFLKDDTYRLSFFDLDQELGSLKKTDLRFQRKLSFFIVL